MFRRILFAGVVASSIVGCSLFVSLDGLSDGGADAGAPDAAQSDAALDAANASDASVDAGNDGAPYFVVDDCISDSADVVDLTIAGATDWTHYGSDADLKSVAQHVIGPLGQSSNGNNPYSDDARMFSWTDGTFVPSVANTTAGIYDDTGPMTIAVGVTPSRSVITFYINNYSASATWMVGLSPGAAPVSQSLGGLENTAVRYRCAIHVASAVPATVTIVFAIDQQLADGGGGNIAMIAGTVSAE